MARDTDTNDTSDQAVERPICPECGHENIPGAAFCSRCGYSLDGDARDDSIDTEHVDSQATSTFQPVTSTVTSPTASPWARPTTMDGGDPGQTSVLPTPEMPAPIAEVPPMTPAGGGIGPRGFVLGVIALLLILAVLAVYIYVAWLGDSTRATVDGWLPWM